MEIADNKLKILLGNNQGITVTVSQKAALSLLISIFLFAGFAVLAYTGLFDLVESRFYNPSITRHLEHEAGLDGETIQEFLAELQSRFEETLREPAIRRSMLPNQSAEDIFERTRIYGTLLESLGGLQSVRFVDAGGLRIHFSTLPQDILSQDRLSIAYRNYTEDSSSLPYDQVEVSAEEKIKFTLDESRDRIILSLPFFDSFEVYRGTALFSVSVRAAADRLIARNRIKAGDDVSIVSNPPGIVSGLPGTSKNNILSRVATVWSDGLLSLTPLDSTASETTLILISAKTSRGIFVGRLVNETLFVFPQPMKVILLVSIFFTIYLVIFLSFNLRQDTITVIQNRLKNLQISLLEQYYDRKGDVDWTHWARELEQRREDIRTEIKRGVRVREGKRSEENIDALIDKSWDELLTALNGRRKPADLDEEKLQTILNRILQAVPAVTAAPGASGVSPQALPLREQEAEPEELEELPEEPELLEAAGGEEKAEAVEELEAVEALEEVEELEELEGAEESGETGAVPSIDLGDLNLADEVVDSAINAARPDEEPAELEELEELEEVEEVEGAEEFGGPEEAGKNVDSLASLIEFSPVPETNAAGQEDSILNRDFEIVSPLSSMLSNISISADEEAEPPEAAPDFDAALPAAEPETPYPPDNYPEENSESEAEKKNS